MASSNGLGNGVVDTMNEALGAVLDPLLPIIALDAMVNQIVTDGPSEFLQLSVTVFLRESDDLMKDESLAPILKHFRVAFSFGHRIAEIQLKPATRVVSNSIRNFILTSWMSPLYTYTPKAFPTEAH
jgi:hypothetical protein